MWVSPKRLASVLRGEDAGVLPACLAASFTDVSSARIPIPEICPPSGSPPSGISCLAIVRPGLAWVRCKEWRAGWGSWKGLEGWPLFEKCRSARPVEGGAGRSCNGGHGFEIE